MKKCVLITGACINTGVAIVDKFASEGWNVVFTGRNSESVEKSLAEYRKKYHKVCFPLHYTWSNYTYSRRIL